MVFQSRSRTESIYRGLEAAGYDAGLVLGGFFLLVALAMAAQTYFTSRHGYMYSGVASRVYRTTDPRRYRLWAVVQCSFVLFFTAAGLVFLSRM